MWHGAFLFLLGLLTGLVTGLLPNPRVGLSSHLEGVMNGLLLLVLGLAWGHLRLSARGRTALFWLALYGTYANWASTLLAAIFGAGHLTPITGAGHRAVVWQENLVGVGLVTLTVAMLAVCIIALFGLRGGAAGINLGSDEERAAACQAVRDAGFGGCAAPNVTSEAQMTRRVSALVAAVAVAAAGIAFATPARSDDNDSDAFTAAAAKLETLPIKGRAPKTGYSRDAFGPAWTDDVRVEGGHNGCDTRNDIVHRDLIEITVKPGSNGCTVLSGTLLDPYTGRTIPFNRGAKTSAVIQIDHVVALGDAWQKGAQQLDRQTRQGFANDPRNLQATDGKVNEQKGDGDAATWLPPNKAYRCTYVSRQVDVKAQYGLWVTQAERDVIARVLTGCGATTPSPAEASASAVGDNPVAAPAPVPVAPPPALVNPAPPPADNPAPVPDPGPQPGEAVVHPGAFCSPPGATGISATGQPMICSLAKGGRHRWTAE